MHMSEKINSNENNNVKIVSEVLRENMTASDIEDLRELRTYLSQNEDWSKASDEKVLTDFFWDNAHSYIIRGDLDNRIDGKQRIVATGQLDLSAGDKVGTVEHIVAHPDMRGHGIGRKIVEHIIKVAREDRLDKLVLTSNPTRKAAHGLYKSLGFKIVGEQQKFDSDGIPTHITCVFELDLMT